MAAECDVIVVLGGDGTILSAAEAAARHDVPMLGVNIGHMGFMTELTPAGLPDAMERLRAGEFEVERRMMICASCGDMPVQTALNDIVLYRPNDELHLVKLHVNVGGADMGRIMSDGLIIATPTGRRSAAGLYAADAHMSAFAAFAARSAAVLGEDRDRNIARGSRTHAVRRQPHADCP